MSHRPTIMLNSDSSKHKRPPLSIGFERIEPMQVIPMPDPNTQISTHSHKNLRTPHNTHRTSLQPTPYLTDKIRRQRPKSHPDHPQTIPGPYHHTRHTPGSLSMTIIQKIARTFAIAIAITLALTLTLSMGGCFYAKQMLSKSPGGNMTSDDSYTYVSTPYEPLTITLYDNRDHEPIWTVDVPIGSKVSLKFLKNKAKEGTTRRPDIMQWAIYEDTRRTARYDNSMAVPPAESRMMRVSLRNGPEFPEEKPKEQIFPDPDHQWLPVEPRQYRNNNTPPPSAPSSPSASYTGN